MMQDSIDAAQELVDELLTKGFDYSKHLNTIAEQLFDRGIFNGNWDSSTDLGDPELRDLRAIQEDEYDQHMDDDEKPDFDEQICFSAQASAYVWFS